MPGIPRTGAEAEPDLEVVWDGSHHGRDLDLLADGIVRQEKVAAPRLSRSQPTNLPGEPTFQNRVLRVLSDVPMTMREVSIASQLTIDRANAALYALRSRGLVELVKLTTFRRQSGYRLKGTP